MGALFLTSASTTMTTTPRPASGSRFLDLVSGRRRGLLADLQRLGLWIASCAYGLAVRLRNVAYAGGWVRSSRASVPVISVGNLTVGGTGKTPFVEYLAGVLSQRGYQVAVLSRGYGSSDGPNDEALVLEENLPDVPHLQGPDRAALAAIAVEELESEVLVLDDGFQHRRLARDLDIVLLDATCPLGPRPPAAARADEPPSGLRRAGRHRPDPLRPGRPGRTGYPGAGRWPGWPGCWSPRRFTSPWALLQIGPERERKEPLPQPPPLQGEGEKAAGFAPLFPGGRGGVGGGVSSQPLSVPAPPLHDRPVRAVRHLRNRRRLSLPAGPGARLIDFRIILTTTPTRARMWRNCSPGPKDCPARPW